MEQESLKKQKTKPQDIIDLNIVSHQERLQELKLRAYELQHYPLSHMQTIENRNQGITEGSTYPEYLTTGLVDTMSNEESDEFLSSITLPEVKQPKLEPTLRELALKYYVQDPEKSYSRPEFIPHSTLGALKNLQEITGTTYGKSKISAEGIEKLHKLKARQELNLLYRNIFYLDSDKQIGLVTISQMLNSFLQLTENSITVRTTDIINSFSVNMNNISSVLSILSQPENGLIDLVEKNKGGKYYKITERGKEFAVKASELLHRLDLPLLLDSRLKEKDVNNEAIEGVRQFIYPARVTCVEQILSLLYTHTDLTRLEVVSHLKSGDLNKSFNFLYNTGYVHRERGENNEYAYTINEKGKLFYNLISLRSRLESELESMFQKNDYKNEFSVKSFVRIMSFFNHNSPSSVQQFVDAINIKIGTSTAPYLESLSPAILYSQSDPASTSTPNPRKLYSLTDYAKDFVLPVIQEYEEVEFKLLQEVKQWEAAGYKFY